MNLREKIMSLTTYNENIWSSKAVKKSLELPKGLKKSPYPDFIKPELATLIDKPPENDQWLHEIKFDGYRILAFKQGNEVILYSRTKKDWTRDFESIAKAIKTLAIQNIVLDGEVVILDKQGKSNFQLLQNSIKSKKHADFIYFIFDILYYDHYDLRKLPLIERKDLLKQVLNEAPPVLQYSDHLIQVKGQEVFENACGMALEGIISKRTDSPYLSKRSKDWVKIKCLKRQEFVIGGYTPPQGSREHFGSLLLGVYNKKGQLNYAGNVGTGFTKNTLKELHEQLQKHASDSNPFTTEPKGLSRIHWVKPKLVGEVEFTEWTEDKHLRHPSFKGLRLDKKASEVLLEEETPLEEVAHQFKLTNPHKILYSEDKITKEDLLHYYDSLSEYILPFLSLRPLTLVRCPSQYKECFFQRHPNKNTPLALHSLQDSEEKEDYIYLDNKEGLFSLVQMGVLEIHIWGSTITHLDQPDLIVFDLDPAPDVPWKKVVATALELRDHLAQYQLKSFVKTTGGKGLHVVVPIQPQYHWGEVKEFTHVFVQLLEQLNPKEYISTMTKSKRRGKIFIDYLRNQRTATAIAPYSTRAKIHAPVSTPLSFEELSQKIEDNTYTIKTLPERLNQLKEDPWKDFWEIKQSLRLDE